MLTWRWLSVTFTQWSRPACQPGLSRYRLKSLHGQGNSICSGTRTANLASASMSPLYHHHIHGWTSPDFPASAGSLLQPSWRFPPLQQCSSLSISHPDFSRSSGTALPALGPVPSLLRTHLWPYCVTFMFKALHDRPLPALQPWQSHVHPSPSTSAKRIQILVLARCLHPCWSLGLVYLLYYSKTHSFLKAQVTRHPLSKMFSDFLSKDWLFYAPLTMGLLSALALGFLFVCFCFLAALHSLWDLSSLTRDRTHTTAVKAWSPNHWTAREFPSTVFLFLASISVSLPRLWAVPWNHTHVLDAEFYK